MYSIRKFRYDDEESVINLWNKCLTRDPINSDTFHKRILLDPNFNRELCLVAEAEEVIVGFILGIVRKYPYEERGMEPDRAWIPIMFVDSKYRVNRVGTSLLNEMEKLFIKLNRKNVTLAAYSPNYFFPGPDKVVYSDSIEFFKKRGYEVLGEAVGMDKLLYDFKIPEEIYSIEGDLKREGYRVECFNKKYTLPLLEFMQENFPGGWVRNAREALLKNRGEDTIILALDKDDAIVGYCQRAIDDLEGHFGPFGVSETLRGKRLGTVLFYKMLFDMYSKGIYHVWLAWTDGAAQKFYERAGMKVNKTHAVMKKSLQK